jgi:hypothetical protein
VAQGTDCCLVRITFLVGSLEPGRDGVGDYARLIARECSRLGAPCQLVALADRHVPRRSADHDSGVEVVRLPYQMAWPEKLDAVRGHVESFQSTWVSLQFVPYSFDRWGLPLHLIRGLPNAISTARLHLMFHEIWIRGGDSWRRRLTSAVQRRCVLALCRHPGAQVHTSTVAYRRMLEHYGVRSGLLPLFGNVPVSSKDAMPWLGPQLADLGVNVVAGRERWWLFVLFGTLHPEWPPEPLISCLQQAAAERGRRVAIISVGRLGGGESQWAALQSRYGRHVPMMRLGEQPVERISELLNSVDFGIATSPYALLGKSGTVAAMLDHGLPVIVNREDSPFGSASPLDATAEDLVIRLDAQLAGRLSAATRREPQWRLPAVANQFLADLGGAPRSSWSS